MITLIAACSKNRVIGIDGDLPWRLPEDMKRFKRLTLGKNVVMGRKTFQSLNKPLSDRNNIVLTKDKNFEHEGVEVFSNIIEVIRKHDEIIVIGGGEIYKQFLPIADKIELTIIDKDFTGDTYFPELDSSWSEQTRETHHTDEFTYHFVTLVN